MINEIRHRPSGAVPSNAYGAAYPPNASSYPPNATPYPTGGNYATPSGGYPNNNYVQVLPITIISFSRFSRFLTLVLLFLKPNQRSGPLGQLGTALGVGGGAVGAAIAARSLKPVSASARIVLCTFFYSRIYIIQIFFFFTEKNNETSEENGEESHEIWDSDCRGWCRCVRFGKGFTSWSSSPSRSPLG